MKIEYIHSNDANSSLILIFAGWSSEPSHYADVAAENWDVAVVYDYSDLSFDSSFLQRYATVWLFAWSLGVRAAAEVIPADRITAAFAINGTLNPVDDREGIPTAIFNGTAENLDNRGLQKFQRRMSPDSETFKSVFCRDFSTIEIDSLRKQLYNIRSLGSAADNALPWFRAYIGMNDRIFPPANTLSAWNQKGVETISLPGVAHYTPISQVVASVVPNYRKIGNQFRKAADTYNRNAIAQTLIARKLVEIIGRKDFIKHGNILEIGSGTGIFSRLYADTLLPERVDYVDIMPAKEIGIAPVETYHCCDAETWLRNSATQYDAILSSSTLQWFSNIPDFFRNCSRVLKPGGSLLLSSFTSGNLGELDALRPSPLHYHTQDQYKEWAEKYFTNVEVFSDEITLKFETPRQLLMHLKNTGVKGSAPNQNISASALADITQLTYRPVFIYATARG